MHISQKFNLPIQGHRQIDFIDIDEKMDTKLFIDPYVIQALTGDELCVEASKSINTFFCEVFQACRDNNTKRLRGLLEYASEPNETNLGLKRLSAYGKGATATELSSLFLEFYKIVLRNPYLENNPLALCMYIRNFDKDKMSDLITNIIRKLLYDFTVSQCEIWNIQMGTDSVFLGCFWDYNDLLWKELYGPPLFVGQKNILLVPKYIVRSRYVFNVECYIKQYILKTLQKDHADQNTDMCSTKEYKDGRRVVIPPTIGDLYEHDVHGTIHKDYAFSCSAKDKTNEEDFINDISRRIKAGYGAITDAKLDEIVYGQHVHSA